jgi:DNA helicase-2/ATP-dependent DNA helicase PcrA
MLNSPLQGNRNNYNRAVEELRRNNAQWQVFESKGHCVVRAGPGSGKTKALTTKLMRMLQEDVPAPRGIACLTYNAECARELSRRLEKLGFEPRQNVFVGTVHSFCLSCILMPYGTLANMDLPSLLTVASTSQVSEHQVRAFQEVFGADRKTWPQGFDSYRRTHLDRNSVEWSNTDRRLARAIECYENSLHASELIDFDDMVLHGLRLVQSHEWVRKLLKARFPILVVDEYQDLGLPLHRLVEVLCFNSIYGFAGAKPQLLNALSERDDVESVLLRTNYRCAKNIVRASETVLGKQNGEYDTPEDSIPGEVLFHQCTQGLQAQAEKICNELIPNALRDVPEATLGDLAVLYVDSNDGDVIAAAAKQAGHNFIRIDKNAPYRRTPLTRWLEECAKWCSGGWRSGNPRLSTLIFTWLSFSRQNEDVTVNLLLAKRRLVTFLWAHRESDAILAEWLGTFYDDCLSDVFNPDCQYADELDVLRELQNQANSGGQLAEYRVQTLAGQGGAKDHLNLITLHSAKGLEYKVVYLLGMEQGRIPWLRAEPEKKAESRRLFFVGLTRAKYEANILYSGWYLDRYKRYQCHGLSEFAAPLLISSMTLEDLI